MRQEIPKGLLPLLCVYFCFRPGMIENYFFAHEIQIDQLNHHGLMILNLPFVRYWEHLLAMYLVIYSNVTGSSTVSL